MQEEPNVIMWESIMSRRRRYMCSLRHCFVLRSRTGRSPSVSRVSRRALTTLKDEGLITPVIGKGYYVAGT
jgi:hypothetical protein